jgi:pimeloyl-ACP methyl ester carboxylesterase
LVETDRQAVGLADGRRLGYAEYGLPGGDPVFYFHGLPASRLEAAVLDPAARRRGARVIAVDRPGFGLSDPAPARTLTSFADDVAALAAHLRIARFAVLGVSAGGPYALACALRVPERLVAVGVVGGLGPVYQDWAAAGLRWHASLAFRLARLAPWLLWPVHGALVGNFMRLFPGLTHRIVAAAAPEADSRVLNRPEIREPMVASLREAMRQGPSGALQELVLLARPWGFRLEDIAVPVDLWHGEDDLVVPPEHSRHHHEALPRGSRLRLLPGEGHFSLPIDHIDEILGTLLSGKRS